MKPDLNTWYRQFYKWRSRDIVDLESTKWDRTTGVTTTFPGLGWREHQCIFTKNNPYTLLGRAGNLDIGGPFQSLKVTLTSSPDPYVLTQVDTNGPRRIERGELVTSTKISSLLKENLNSATAASSAISRLDPWCPNLIQDSVLDSIGTTAINRVAPTSPVFDASQSIAELLREGLFSAPGHGLYKGKVKRNRSRDTTRRDDIRGTSRDAAGEYLNLQFGVLPVVNDAIDAHQTIRNSKKILQQLRRDSGRQIRRRYDFETPDTQFAETVVSNTPCAWTNGRNPEIYVASLGTRYIRTITYSKTWFSGAFTYHIPTGILGRLYELDRLYGVMPGYDTAYNLMPFSWLVDYFSNLGDIVENLQSLWLDGLVMPYGYVMCTQYSRTEETWKGNVMIDGASTPITLSDSYEAVTMQRRQASPYGFELTDDLTSRQLSILAALGISLGK